VYFKIHEFLFIETTDIQQITLSINIKTENNLLLHQIKSIIRLKITFSFIYKNII